MIWSWTGGSQFKACPRQWYYDNIVANSLAKRDSDRVAITTLSKLQTLDAWRGSIIDRTIGRIIYGIAKKFALNENYYINESLKEFRNQLEYAQSKRYWNEDIQTVDKKVFAALIPYEFGLIVSNEELERLQNDMVHAITGFLNNKELIKYLQSASHLITQRIFTYKLNSFTVRAIPDLVAFFKDRAPHIFDWKVHTFGVKTYDQQLLSYAIGLHKAIQTKPHRDFPTDQTCYSLLSYKLTEYQLLRDDINQRHYSISDQAIDDLKEYISSSTLEIYMTMRLKKYQDLQPEMFETANFPEVCFSCPFQKVCKYHEQQIRNRSFSDN